HWEAALRPQLGRDDAHKCEDGVGQADAGSDHRQQPEKAAFRLLGAHHPPARLGDDQPYESRNGVNQCRNHLEGSQCTLLRLPGRDQDLPARPWLQAARETYPLATVGQMRMRDRKQETGNRKLVNWGFRASLSHFLSPVVCFLFPVSLFYSSEKTDISFPLQAKGQEGVPFA